MPADYASIVRGGPADLEFLRHERKDLSQLPSLASKDGSIRRAYFDKKSEERSCSQLWHGMNDPYGFDWMALCPLIAIALYRQNSGAAIGFAQGLLAENQHPLPEKLLNPIRKTCDEWQIGAQEIATADLASAMKVARELSYL